MYGRSMGVDRTVTAEARLGNIGSQPSRAGTRVYVPIRLARTRPYAVLPRFPHHRLPSFIPAPSGGLFLFFFAPASAPSLVLFVEFHRVAFFRSSLRPCFLSFCAAWKLVVSLLLHCVILRPLLVLVLSILSFCSIPGALVSLWKRVSLKSFHICQTRGRKHKQEPGYHPDLLALTV